MSKPIEAHSYQSAKPIEFELSDAMEETGEEGIIINIRQEDGISCRLDLLNAAAMVAHLTHIIKKQYEAVGDECPIE